MVVIGWILIVAAVIWILYKISVAYNSYGGTVMVAVYDAAIFAPALGAVGLFVILPTFGIQWALWIYIAVAVGTSIAVAVVIRIAEELGDKEL